MATAVQQVFGVLRHGLPMTTNEVIEADGRNPNTARNALQKLAAEGRVERVGTKPARYARNLQPWPQIEWRIASKRRGRR
jgi:predicted transcriptional regulator of viral defense system